MNKIADVAIFVGIIGVIQMTVSIHISGLKRVIKKFEELEKGDIYKDTIRQTAENAVKYAKMNAPELTGTMMNAIDAKVSENGFVLDCHVPWAVFNEYGSMFMKVGFPTSPMAVVSGSGKYAFRPFMRPAMYRATAEFPEIFGKKWARIWK